MTPSPDVKGLVALAKDRIALRDAFVLAGPRYLMQVIDELGDALEAFSQQRGCDGPDDLLAGLVSVSGRDPRTIRIDFHDIDAANRVFDWLTELNPVLTSPSPPTPTSTGVKA